MAASSPHSPVDPNEGLNSRPCLHMKSMLSGLSDGTLKGLLRWYAERHVAGCRHCAPALSAIVVLEARLRSLRVTGPEDDARLRLDEVHRAAAEKGWNAIDAEVDSLKPEK